MKAKLTPWFPGNIKPARPGVYQQRCIFFESVGYQRWDGSVWYCWAETAEQAASCTIKAETFVQNDEWRGLAEPPKGGAR